MREITLPPVAIQLHWSPEDAYAVWEKATAQLKQAKAQIAAVEEVLTDEYVAYLQKNGEFDTGSHRIYAGVAKKAARCRDSGAVLAWLLGALAGDVDAIAECLASNAWKHGEVRHKLNAVNEGWGDELFERFWDQPEVPVVKTGKLRVQKVDKKYIKEAKK